MAAGGQSIHIVPELHLVETSASFEVLGRKPIADATGNCL
jgi:hypothetical protein